MIILKKSLLKQKIIINENDDRGEKIIEEDVAIDKEDKGVEDDSTEEDINDETDN